MTFAYIAYAREDQRRAIDLRDRLQKHGIVAWVDQRGGIRTGEEWRAAVRKAILNCGAVVVVLTPASAASEWVQAECATALALGKPVLPIRHDGARLPEVLGQIQVLEEDRLDDDAFIRCVKDHCEEPADEKVILEKASAALRNLDRADWDRALDTLTELDGDGATNLLREKLAHPARQVRRRVAILLAKRDCIDAAPVLIEILETGSDAELWGAIEGLCETHPQQMMKHAMELVDAKGKVTRTAAVLLENTADDSIADRVIEWALEEPDGFRSLANVLGRLQDERIYPILLAKVIDPDEDDRARAVRVLRKRLDRVANSLRPLLSDGDPDIRFAAAHALLELKEEQATHEIVRSLIELLGDTAQGRIGHDPGTDLVGAHNSDMAETILSRVGRPHMSSIEAVLQEGLPEARKRAAAVLGNLREIDRTQS